MIRFDGFIMSGQNAQKWHPVECILTERGRIVVVFGEVLLLCKDVVDARVLVEQINMGVCELGSSGRWLLHAYVHHDSNRVVNIAKLLDRFNIARQLLRGASNSDS